MSTLAFSTNPGGRRRVTTVPRIPPPSSSHGAALAQRALAKGARSPTNVRTVTSLTISLVSFSMAGAAASRFRQNGTTLEPFQPDRASVLVTSGANAISRNPMYVGMAGLLLAHAVWRGTGRAPSHGRLRRLHRPRPDSSGGNGAPREVRGAATTEAYRAATPRWIDRRSVGFT